MQQAKPPVELSRIPVLDGWRGASILLVLLGHLFPLGPKSWDLNAASAAAGMVLFFNLSGFLITGFLLRNQNVREFLTRRFFRILPLAWLYILILLPLQAAAWRLYPPHLLFYLNLPPFWMTPGTDHLWSLCVEMQFYVGIALLVLLLRRRGLFLLPILCLAVTVLRVVSREPVSIVTWFRIDEILAGATLSLIYAGELGASPQKLLGKIPPLLLFPVVLLASHSRFLPLNYLRPYIAAMTIGATLFQPQGILSKGLRLKWLAYVAEVSYALYVIHPALQLTWLGSGEKMVKYLKRPLFLAALFLLAHLSTFYYEHPCLEFGKKLAKRWRRPQAKPVQQVGN